MFHKFYGSSYILSYTNNLLEFSYCVYFGRGLDSFVSSRNSQKYIDSCTFFKIKKKKKSGVNGVKNFVNTINAPK
jgi:hypothetical protein